MSRFFIRGRRSWGAAPAQHRTIDRWSNGVTLVVHHTAGSAPTDEPSEHAELRSCQLQHFANGWSDIGYNYIIMPSGRVYEGRGFNIRGAHTMNHNSHTIGVSFAGNYEKRRPTRKSIRAYKQLVKKLQQNGATILYVRGHKQMPNQSTACPGKYLMRALKL